MESIPIRYLEKSEVKVISTSFELEFTESVNRHLKDGWIILASSCDTFEVPGTPHFNCFYQSILYKETYK